MDLLLKTAAGIAYEKAFEQWLATPVQSSSSSSSSTSSSSTTSGDTGQQSCSVDNSECGEVPTNYELDDGFLTGVLIGATATPFVVQPELLGNVPLVSGVVEGDLHAIDYTYSQGSQGNPSGVLEAWGQGFIYGFFFEELGEP